MKYKEFEFPNLIKEEDGYCFKLYDGTLTKKFASAKSYDSAKGTFAICNSHGKVVEYMDLMGNFTKKPTKFASDFKSYMASRNYGIVFVYASRYDFYTHLIDFPSKYLVDDKVKNVVWNEEMSRYQEACDDGMLLTMMSRLHCRRYIKNVFKNKVKKANKLKQKIKETLNSKDLNSTI